MPITKQSILDMVSNNQVRTREEIAEKIEAFFSQMTSSITEETIHLSAMSVILFWALGLDPERAAVTCKKCHYQNFKQPEPTEADQKAVGEYIAVIKQCHINEQINDINNKINTATDLHQKLNLIKELSSLKKQLRRPSK